MNHDIRVGIMGPGKSATRDQCMLAEWAAVALMNFNFPLISGGMNTGTMRAACKVVYEKGGTVIGVGSSNTTEHMNPFVTTKLPTGMGEGRNYLNIRWSDIVIAIGSRDAGTLSEVAFAVELERPLLILGSTDEMRTYLEQLVKREQLLSFAVPEKEKPHTFGKKKVCDEIEKIIDFIRAHTIRIEQRMEA